MNRKPTENETSELQDGFLGREDMLSFLENKFFLNQSNVSLVGLPQVGKTVLAKETLHRIASLPHFDASRTLFLYTNLATSVSFEEYWRDTLSRIYDLAEEQGITHPVLQREIAYIRAPESLTYTQLKTRGELFLRRLKALGVTTYIVVDEFDVAINLFKGQRYYYEFFRDLGSGGEYSVRFLVLSRQQIKEVETNAYGNSTLFAIFEERGVREFTETEVERYYDRLAAILARPIADEDKAKVYHYAGRFPALITLVGSSIAADRNERDISQILAAQQTNLLHRYDAIFKQMMNDKSLEQVVQVVNGPSYMITQHEVDVLWSMGYIFPDRNADSWTVVSPAFQDYLRRQKLDIPVGGSLLSIQAEIQSIIKTGIKEQFDVSEQDIDQIIERENIIPGVDIERYKAYVEKNLQEYSVTSCMIDVVSIKVLGAILQRYWPVFKKYFGKRSFEYWKEKIELLNWARNPVMHAHPEYLNSTQRKQVNAICLELSECLGLHTKHKRSPERS